MKPTRSRTFGLPIVIGVILLALAGTRLDALAALLVIGAIPVAAFAAMFGAKKLAESAGAVIVAGILVATLWAGFAGWAQTAANGLFEAPGQLPAGLFGVLLLGLLGLLGVGGLFGIAKVVSWLDQPGRSPTPRPPRRERVRVVADPLRVGDLGAGGGRMDRGIDDEVGLLR